MQIKFFNNKGFTLIETMIYIALFSVLIGGGMIGAYQIIMSSDSTSAKVIAEQEAVFVIQKINSVLTGATIANPSPTNPGPNLTVTNVTNYSFNLVGTHVELNSTIITSENIKISSLSFTKIPGGSTKPDAIRTKFNVTDTKGKTESFESLKY